MELGIEGEKNDSMKRVATISYFRLSRRSPLELSRFALNFYRYPIFAILTLLVSVNFTSAGNYVNFQAIITIIGLLN